MPVTAPVPGVCANAKGETAQKMIKKATSTLGACTTPRGVSDRFSLSARAQATAFLDAAGPPHLWQVSISLSVQRLYLRELRVEERSALICQRKITQLQTLCLAQVFEPYFHRQTIRRKNRDTLATFQ